MGEADDKTIEQARAEDRSEAANLLKAIAAIMCPNMSVKKQIGCLVDELGAKRWRFDRTRELWYERTRVVEGWELRELGSYRPKF